MQLQVAFFAHASRVAGVSRDSLDLPSGSTVSDAVELLLARHPALAELRSTLQFAVDEELVDGDRRLEGGETLALLPPFSGG